MDRWDRRVHRAGLTISAATMAYRSKRTYRIDPHGSGNAAPRFRGSRLIATTYLEWLAEHFRDASGGPQGAGTAGSRHVLGYATGYGVAQIAPFVLSLRAWFPGEVTLVVDPDPAMLTFLAAHDVRVLHRAPVSGWRPHVAVERLATFEALLRGLPERASVLLSDVRDVVFQSDPLSPEPTAIEAFEEPGTCGDHAFNMKYITALVGSGLADVIRDKPALCVGTVAGPAGELARLCRVLLMLSARPRSALGGAFGADQAGFNIAVHLDLVPVACRPNFSRVATLGLVDGAQLKIDGDWILNPDGGASPIVHQYDRHEHLHAHIRRLWSVDLPARRQTPARPFLNRLRRHMDSIRRRVPELR